MNESKSANGHALRLRQMLLPPGYNAHVLTEAADEIDRLNAALQYEQHRTGRMGTHADGCYAWGPAHYECAMREIDRLREDEVRIKYIARKMWSNDMKNWYTQEYCVDRINGERPTADELRAELDDARGKE